jgi:hypothetical protein
LLAQGGASYKVTGVFERSATNDNAPFWRDDAMVDNNG